MKYGHHTTLSITVMKSNLNLYGLPFDTENKQKQYIHYLVMIIMSHAQKVFFKWLQQ